MEQEYQSKYAHRQKTGVSSLIREIVFGMEDGMVSTLGSITGIAAATKDPFTTILAGFVLVAVESISMGVGSYLSSKSEKAIDEQKLVEEREEIKKFPREERDELRDMYVESGWPKNLADKMADTALANPDLMLKEMAYRELEIIPDNLEQPFRNGVAMLISYIIGGSVPLIPYLIFQMEIAIVVSIIVTLVGLFILGVVTTIFTKRPWWKSGGEILLLGGAAALVGYAVGQMVDTWWLSR